MKYLLFLTIFVVAFLSLCSYLPEIPYINPGNETKVQPGVLLIQTEPDLFVRVDYLPDIKIGRTNIVSFEIENKNKYDLRDVNVEIYDPCIFTGETSKKLNTVEANKTVSFSLKLVAGSTELDKSCDIKFKITYDTTYSIFQDIAVLKKSEYEQREMSGTLNNIPIRSSYQNSPLRVLLSFSDEQPFMENEKYYMYINYENTGNGFLEVKSGKITMAIPNNMIYFSCNDYSGSTLNKDLNFIENRASSSTCSFNTTTSQPMSIQSLTITSSYKYVLYNSILVKVRRL